MLYRFSHFLYNIKLSILAKIVWFINRILFCVDIDYRAKIGKRFMIIHGLGIVIGRDVVIGDNVKIYQGVTIGGSGKTKIENGKTITQPIIGDNCIIYTNACLVQLKLKIIVKLKHAKLLRKILFKVV